MRQSVLSAVMACGTLGAEQRFDVRWMLDLLAFAIAARVLGDHLAAIEYTHAGQRGHDRYGAPHVGVRYTVVVQIEAYIGRFADTDLDPLVGFEGIVRQCKELCVLLLKGLTHRHTPIFRARSVGGGACAPGVGLRIQIIDIGPLTASKEVVANIAYRPFNAALLVTPGDGNRSGFEVVVRGQRQQGRMELDCIITTLEHG